MSANNGQINNIIAEARKLFKYFKSKRRWKLSNKSILESAGLSQELHKEFREVWQTLQKN